MTVKKMKGWVNEGLILFSPVGFIGAAKNIVQLIGLGLMSASKDEVRPRVHDCGEITLPKAEASGQKARATDQNSCSL